MLRRHKVVVGAALAALAALTGNALAHVTVGVPTLEVTTLQYRAPVEPTPATPEELAAHHTERLVVTFPAGFRVESCPETRDFICTFDIDEVTWTRRPESTN